MAGITESAVRGDLGITKKEEVIVMKLASLLIYAAKGSHSKAAKMVFESRCRHIKEVRTRGR